MVRLCAKYSAEKVGAASKGLGNGKLMHFDLCYRESVSAFGVADAIDFHCGAGSSGRKIMRDWSRIGSLNGE
jgi:hypothetical protein